MIKIPQTLIEEIIKRKILPKKKIEEAINKAKDNDKELTQVLIEDGLISDQGLLEIKSELYKLPIIDLNKFRLSNEALKIIPEEIATFYKLVPIEKSDNILKIGLVNPEDIDALEALKFIAQDKNFALEKYLISWNDFQNVIKNYRSLASEVKVALEELSEELTKKEIKVTPGVAPPISEEAPIIKAVAVIIKHAVESRASDIHIEPQEDKTRVRFRIDGVLGLALELPKTIHSAIVTRIKILSDLKIDETRIPQDGRFSTIIENKKIDFRISTLPTRHGEKVVLRILDPLVGLIDLPDLGLTGRNLRLVLEYIEKPYGSILITGPTGSGKTTTLYSILRKINDESINIVTLEDPIEILLPGVNQSQIQEEIGYTFANGLRHILRQDPDVVLVGEIRDQETASLTTHASLTGHLVLSTLHTNDSIGVIPRLIDLGVEKYLIAPTLNLAIAQRLLRRLCPDCKIKTKPNTAEEKIIKQAIEDMPEESRENLEENKIFIYKASEKGCSSCKGRAYKGRIGIFEVFEITDEVEKIILTDLSESNLREEAKRQGMLTMFQDGILKVLDGIVSLEELLQVAESGE